MQARAKVWLEQEDGRLLFGDGAARLLLGIRKYGSITRAAAELKMSYRLAWGVIRKVERRLGTELIQTRVGGEEGGGTSLTEVGEQLLQRFLRLQDEVGEFTRRTYAQLFPEKDRV